MVSGRAFAGDSFPFRVDATKSAPARLYPKMANEPDRNRTMGNVFAARATHTHLLEVRTT